MSSTLKIHDLTIQFGIGRKTKTVVDHLSLVIGSGERVAIVGESGSGKSLTALSILGLQPESATVTGRVEWGGKDLLRLPIEELRAIRGREISMIFQEPMTALNPLFTIGNQIMEAVIVHEPSISKSECNAKAQAMLHRVGIPDVKNKMKAFPHQLSGGQRQRAMIAMALATQPSLLIADEPTTALDVGLRKQILDLLMNLQADPIGKNMSILLITHDLNLVQKFANRVAVMHQGKLVEMGSTHEIFHQPQLPYTQSLVNSKPERQVVPLMPLATSLLKTEQLSVGYPVVQSGWEQITSIWRKTKFHDVLKNVQLDLKQGETLGIIGESGSGKTTLGMALLGLKPGISARVTGDFEIFGKSWGQKSPREQRQMRAKLQAIFQDPFGSLSPRMSVGQIIEEGLIVHQPNLSKSARLEKVAEVLEEVGLDRYAIDRYPHEFSGGQRQRISIARALILKPEILILDEPTSALDVTIQKQILELLTHLQHKYNLSYIFISHDLSVIQAMSHRIIVLKDGEVIERGLTDEVLQNPRVEYTKNLIREGL